ncbi:glyoxylate/hydroxypyruvate reductase A [Arsenicitalea aurantiaca]|uniref:Glyoxylate/hydroxypyruvate reductase A n=1 Tax=Arsenicitalea aurantiaca TaxID=1783274 RepID=A0A433X261_9HYPH|nr:glyoxylate/hydroxypyruvate reductase A [Arsenicitalea aurantiaca]RUT28203.1 glyoxylate/hydroxypyruvate reductase A [Arsenicitalea aurantiaca]
MALLLHLNERDETQWAEAFAVELGDYPILRRGDAFDPAEVEYIFVWKPTPDAFEGLSGLKAVLSLGAGVDGLLRHPTLPDAPVVRFVDEELSECMSDYVVAHVAMHQRLHTRFMADQKARAWNQLYPASARTLTVGVMGLGVIGQHALGRLAPLGYTLRGWARSQKSIPGVTCFAGPETFDDFLSGADILVNLLPLTGETEGILNYETFGKLRRGVLEGGPVVINAARGGHQREADLVKALGDGTLAAASLDVFEIEPLPQESPLWGLENCYITPHIAAISNERTGVAYFSRIIAEHRAGKPLPHVVDRDRGY